MIVFHQENHLFPGNDVKSPTNLRKTSKRMSDYNRIFTAKANSESQEVYICACVWECDFSFCFRLHPIDSRSNKVIVKKLWWKTRWVVGVKGVSNDANCIIKTRDVMPRPTSSLINKLFAWSFLDWCQTIGLWIRSVEIVIEVLGLNFSVCYLYWTNECCINGKSNENVVILYSYVLIHAFSISVVMHHTIITSTC